MVEREGHFQVCASVFHERPSVIDDFHKHTPPATLPCDIANGASTLSSPGLGLVVGAGLGQGGEIRDATYGKVNPGNVCRLGP